MWTTFVNVPSSRISSSIIFVIIFDYYCIVDIYFTTYVQQAEYKIPIQYTKVAQGAPSSSYLPLKVNPAGVIPLLSSQVRLLRRQQLFFSF